MPRCVLRWYRIILQSSFIIVGHQVTCHNLAPLKINVTRLQVNALHKPLLGTRMIFRVTLQPHIFYCDKKFERTLRQVCSPHTFSVNSYRAGSKFASSQWETWLQSNTVSHWLDANLDSAMSYSTGPNMCTLFYLVGFVWAIFTILNE